jgi:hypothetical protein
MNGVSIPEYIILVSSQQEISKSKKKHREEKGKKIEYSERRLKWATLVYAKGANPLYEFKALN